MKTGRPNVCLSFKENGDRKGARAWLGWWLSKPIKKRRAHRHRMWAMKRQRLGGLALLLGLMSYPNCRARGSGGQWVGGSTPSPPSAQRIQTVTGSPEDPDQERTGALQKRVSAALWFLPWDQEPVLTKVRMDWSERQNTELWSCPCGLVTGPRHRQGLLSVPSTLRKTRLLVLKEKTTSILYLHSVLYILVRAYLSDPVGLI